MQQAITLLEHLEQAGLDMRKERTSIISHITMQQAGSHRSEAKAKMTEVLLLNRELDYPWGIATTLAALTLLARQAGDFDEAKVLIEEMLVICQAQGYQQVMFG